MADIERTISQYRSLLGRLSSNVVPSDDNEGDVEAEIQNFALELLTEKDVKILGASRGALGMLLSNMFSKDDRVSRAWVGKSFIGPDGGWKMLEHVDCPY